MQPLDPQNWAEHVVEMQKDELGKWYHDALTFWGHTAEVIIAENTVPGGDTYPAAEAVRQAFRITEKTFGRIDSNMMAQLLTGLCLHWVHREALLEHLTTIESRLVQDMTLAKIGALQEMAKSKA